MRTAAACVMLTAALVAAAAPRAPLLVAQPKPARRMVFGSAEYKAAVPRTALLRHVLLTVCHTGLESRTSRLRARPQPTRHSAPGRPATHTCEPRLGQHVSYVLSVGLVQTAVYSCLPYLKDSGVLTQRQISRMLTVGTACFVVGKLSTAQILDQVDTSSELVAS
jgi:hypothetical protein